MRKSHGGFCPVDVLASRAAGAENIYLQIFRLDVDLDVLVDLRIHENGGERSMPPRIGVKWRDANQAMDADLRLQLPVNVLAADFDRSRLNTGAFAFQTIRDNRFVFVALGPAQIHA